MAKLKEFVKNEKNLMKQDKIMQNGGHNQSKPNFGHVIMSNNLKVRTGAKVRRSRIRQTASRRSWFT